MNLLKSVVFVLIVFPFISHIYGAVFPALYNFDIFNIIFVIIVFVVIIAVYEKRIVWDKDIVYFLPFLFINLATSVYSNDLYFLKYFSYIFVYFFFLKRFFLQKFIFKIYVNILVITFLILIVIYFLTIYLDLNEYFRVEHLEYLSQNSPMQTVNSKGQIFYLLVYESSDYSGIFNIPRFYGFSREPGMYVTFIIPGLLMAYFLKMRYQMLVLGCATLIASSFAGFFTLFILFLVAILPKFFFKNVIYILLILIMLLVLFRHNFSFLDSVRINDYTIIIDKTINKYTDSLTGLSISGVLFILTKASYAWILFNFYTKIKIIDLRIGLLFFISFVMLINKANELVSPLFLFYLLFIEYMCKANVCLKKKKLWCKHAR
jgi:hypothetical protein